MSTLPVAVAEAIKGWLAAGEIEVFFGYTPGPTGLRATPTMARTPEEVDALIWDATCEANLAVYIPKHKGHKVGLMAKGCDARAIVGLIQEGQVARENLRIVGAACAGVIDPRRVASALGLYIEELEGARLDTDRLTIEGAEMPLSEAMVEQCGACTQHTPSLYDVLIGEPGGAPRAEPEGAADPYATVHAMEALSADERWARFTAEVSRCNLCYACRNACPLCYCTVCFADRTAPKWANPSAAEEDKQFFQVMRVFHLAGRCVGCGACSRACPQGVNLRLFLDKLRLDAEELFDHQAGVDPEGHPPLRAYRPDDYNGFVM